MAKMGRPRIEIDQMQFETLCKVQCTEEEIANFFKCSVDTIENWCKRTYNTTFSDIYKKTAVNGKISLRRTQFRLADNNVSMAIWLGKQYLNQKDSPDPAGKDDNGILTALVEALKLGKEDK